MATHSNILAWGIPWTEEPGGLQSTGSQRSQTRLTGWTTKPAYKKAARKESKQSVITEGNRKMVEWLRWGPGGWRWEGAASPGDREGVHPGLHPHRLRAGSGRATLVPAVFPHEYRGGNRKSLERPRREDALPKNSHLESNKYREANKKSWQKRGTHLWFHHYAFLWHFAPFSWHLCRLSADKDCHPHFTNVWPEALKRLNATPTHIV